MDRSTPVVLISETYTQNKYGVHEKTITERKVFANVTSVGMSEWFEGGRNGLNPELRLRMFAPDYKGEEVVKVNGKVFTIYRTFFSKNDIIELYVQRKKGNADLH